MPAPNWCRRFWPPDQGCGSWLPAASRCRCQAKPYGRCLDTLPPAAPNYRATALNIAGVLALLEGDHDRAAALAHEAMRVDNEQGCTSLAAWSLPELGLIALYRGDYEQADELFESSLESFRALGDPSGTASPILYQGLTACYRAHDERA